jgi:hypothetical protein
MHAATFEVGCCMSKNSMDIRVNSLYQTMTENSLPAVLPTNLKRKILLDQPKSSATGEKVRPPHT